MRGAALCGGRSVVDRSPREGMDEVGVIAAHPEQRAGRLSLLHGLFPDLEGGRGAAHEPQVQDPGCGHQEQHLPCTNREAVSPAQVSPLQAGHDRQVEVRRAGRLRIAPRQLHQRQRVAVGGAEQPVE